MRFYRPRCPAAQLGSLPPRALVMNLPEVIAAFAFFGAIVICPLVYLIMRHQRSIAEIMHRPAGDDVLQRLHMLEQEVRELKASRYEQLIREDDKRELSRRSG